MHFLFFLGKLISSEVRNKVLERSEQVLISNTFALPFGSELRAELLSVNSVRNKVLERSEQVLISSEVRNKVLE